MHVVRRAIYDTENAAGCVLPRMPREATRRVGEEVYSAAETQRITMDEGSVWAWNYSGAVE